MSKTIRVVITTKMTDEFFAEQGKDMLDEVAQGTFQEEMLDEESRERGILDVTVTAELVD